MATKVFIEISYSGSMPVSKTDREGSNPSISARAVSRFKNGFVYLVQ